MLAKSLKELETDGLIIRHEYLEIPIRVEYSLTGKALALQPILADLARWQMEQEELYKEL
jgi:DNA-binding HxlR family transcriptional regulator